MVQRNNHDQDKTTVFVIDDDPAVRDSLKFLLELEGFIVRLYATGEEFLKEKGISGRVCVLVDQVMPGMSGLDTIDAIRHRNDHCPVILMISHPNVKVKRSAATRGIVVVEKPFVEHALIEAINAVASQTS